MAQSSLLMDLVYEYLTSMATERGAASQTITNYGHYLSRFIGFTDNIPADKLTIDLVRRYQQALNETKLSRATQSYHLIAVRGFLKYCRNHDIPVPDADRIEMPKHERPVVAVLDAQEIRRLLDQPDTEALSGLRDRAILELLFGSGLRVAELVSLDRQQANPDTREFTIRGKGNKLRMVFMTKSSAEWVSDYLAKRQDYSQALFVEYSTNLRNRLNVRSIQRLVKRYAEMADIPKDVTPHTLRHSYATQLLANGADIRSVQELLGHASIVTTQIYTHVTNPQLKNVHDKFLNI